MITNRNTVHGIAFALVILGVSAVAWETLHNDYPLAWSAGVVLVVLCLTLPLLLSDTPPEGDV